MKKRRIALICVFVVLFSMLETAGFTVSAATYSDVKRNHWAFDAISWVTNNGYMNGVGNSQFNPDGNALKGQVITVLHRMSKDGSAYWNEPYLDVSSGHYYFTPICWAYSHNLAQIVQSSSLRFMPDDPIKRIKMAEFLWKYAQYKGLASSTAPNVSLPYNDIGSVTTAQRNALKWCYSEGIMKGTSSTAFSPNSTITRAQLAQIIFNFHHRYIRRTITKQVWVPTPDFSLVGVYCDVTLTYTEYYRINPDNTNTFYERHVYYYITTSNSYAPVNVYLDVTHTNRWFLTTPDNLDNVWLPGGAWKLDFRSNYESVTYKQTENVYGRAAVTLESAGVARTVYVDLPLKH